jgi:hypothetical protein
MTGIAILSLAVYASQYFAPALVFVILDLIPFLLGYGFWTGAHWAYTVGVTWGGFLRRAVFDTYEVRVWFGENTRADDEAEVQAEEEGAKEGEWSGD